MIMHRLIGTIFALIILFSLGSGAVYAYDSPHKLGIEFRGGFGTYNMGDIPSGMETLRNHRADRVITSKDNGPLAGLSVIFFSTKHTTWEIGYNALMDVENLVQSIGSDSSGQILMHANEFFLKGSVVATVSDRLFLDLGAGLGYYNTELQIQDDYRLTSPSYLYDAVGRSWGLVGSAGIEFLLSQRVGLHLGGGFRLTNSNHFIYESSPGNRAELSALGGSRPMEVNLSGAYGLGGIRFYFDRVTKPIDFAH
jgi:hypothetical protein